jgi:hypothetical protein
MSSCRRHPAEYHKLVKIHLLKGPSAAEKATIALSIQSALVSTLEVPDAGRYQPFNEDDVENFRQTSSYGRRGVVAADDAGRANVSCGSRAAGSASALPERSPG